MIEGRLKIVCASKKSTIKRLGLVCKEIEVLLFLGGGAGWKILVAPQKSWEIKRK
jgi:hypothetical protein